MFENSDALEDFNTSVDLVLKASEWSENRPYRQTVRVEGLSEYHTGAVGLSEICTVEEAEIGLNAGIELVEQGNGYIIVEATDIKPTVDLPIYLTYGSNITIVPSPEYVGEANRHVDTVAYASKWTKVPDGWEQEIDVEGITSNSIGTMGLRNKASENQAYMAAVARIKISKVYDNKVLLTATKLRPTVNIPLSFVFGRNINVVKYPGVIGKVSRDANYIAFDDSLINSGLSSIQQLLEYFQKNKINYSDIINNTTSTDVDKPLSANMGKHLEDVKINYTDVIDNTTSTDKNKPLSANMGKHLEDVKINYTDIVNNVTTPDSNKPLSANMGKYLKDLVDTNTNTLTSKITTLETKHDTELTALDNKLTKNITDLTNKHNNELTALETKVDNNKTELNNSITAVNTKVTNLQADMGNTIIKIQSTQPAAVTGKNVVWIKI